jgi:hypothetical protein
MAVSGWLAWMPPPPPVRPFPPSHLDSVLVNFLIRDLPGAIPPHLGDRGPILKAIIQAEGRNHVLKPLGAGEETVGEAG